MSVAKQISADHTNLHGISLPLTTQINAEEIQYFCLSSVSIIRNERKKKQNTANAEIKNSKNK